MKKIRIEHLLEIWKCKYQLHFHHFKKVDQTLHCNIMAASLFKFNCKSNKLNKSSLLFFLQLPNSITLKLRFLQILQCLRFTLFSWILMIREISYLKVGRIEYYFAKESSLIYSKKKILSFKFNSPRSRYKSTRFIKMWVNYNLRLVIFKHKLKINQSNKNLISQKFYKPLNLKSVLYKIRISNSRKRYKLFSLI